MFSIWGSSFSLQTVVCFAKVEKCQNGALHQALLKSILDCLNYSGDMIFTAPTFMKTSLELAKHVVSSRSLTTHDVRLMERDKATSLGDFPALSSGMIVVTLQILGQ